MKKITKFILPLLTGSLVGMHAFNKYTESEAAKKGILDVKKGFFYESRQGKVFYTKLGEGQPLLLLHDISATSSSKEWTGIRKLLAKDHTVYTMDLLGCGRSDKPKIQYTNYLYVQLLRDFANDIIKEPFTIITSNSSAAIALMCNKLCPELFSELIFINPPKIQSTQAHPNHFSRYAQLLMNLPLIGTFIYNVITSLPCIDKNFRHCYYEKQGQITSRFEDTFFEAAHLGEGNGKYLSSSILTNYININIADSINTLNKDAIIIGSKSLSKERNFSDYLSRNSHFNIVPVDGRLYPHLENPEDITTILEMFL